MDLEDCCWYCSLYTMPDDQEDKLSERKKESTYLGANPHLYTSRRGSVRSFHAQQMIIHAIRLYRL